MTISFLRFDKIDSYAYVPEAYATPNNKNTADIK